MNYCSDCGGTISKRVPENDTAERCVCDSCHKVFYQNPTIIAGCLAEWEGKVLLCQRAIEPRIGTWTLPAGFMEIGESIEQAAVREACEETGANIKIDALYSVFYVEQTNQVYIIYRGRMLSPNIDAGDESLEVRLFERDEVPWENIFYPAIQTIVKRFFDEFAKGQYGIYMGSAEQGKVALIDS